MSGAKDARVGCSLSWRAMAGPGVTVRDFCRYRGTLLHIVLFVVAGEVGGQVWALRLGLSHTARTWRHGFPAIQGTRQRERGRSVTMCQPPCVTQSCVHTAAYTSRHLDVL